MKNVNLTISDMKCDGCAEAVRAALVRVEGVRRADVSLDEKTARVVADDAVRTDDLTAAVERAGYAASGEG